MRLLCSRLYRECNLPRVHIGILLVVLFSWSFIRSRWPAPRHHQYMHGGRYLREHYAHGTGIESSLMQTVQDSARERTSSFGQSSFKPNDLNYKLSPHTGLTRKHWIDAGLYILDGVFKYVHNIEDPMKFPKQHGKSYPQNDWQIVTEKLEGLSRTLFVAAPLLKDNPELVVNNSKVADYYLHQLRNLIEPSSPLFIKHRASNEGPHQNLVEFGALAISMFTIPEIIWKPMSQAHKDSIAALMLSYADGPTVDSNWKFFNIFILSFFKNEGYIVNEKLLTEYLEKSLQHYRGEGWYHDSPAFDYYSMWSFQTYGMLWVQFFGNRFYPEISQKFISNFSDLKSNYPYLFGRDGKMIMWGRSISYRYAAAVPFPLMGFENSTQINYGWMRRIASGTLLQFLRHGEYMHKGIPTLGFYGPFEPAVQSYSCRGSVFWSGKIFLGLLVPAENPFWTSIENEGDWETKFEKDQVYNKFQGGSKVLITDYPNIGASEVRATSYQVASTTNYLSTENYNRLSYNSAFPWQADGANGEVAMNYVVMNHEKKWEALRLFVFQKYESGIYYRDALLETNKAVRFRLADMPLSNGILRVDRLQSKESPVSLNFGHYALPQLKGPILEEIRHVRGYNVGIIDNGVYQLALVALCGWKKPSFVHATGLHPESPSSTTIQVSDVYDPNDKSAAVYVTLLLWKRTGEGWTDDELIPVNKIKYSDLQWSITLGNGDERKGRF